MRTRPSLLLILIAIVTASIAALIFRSSAFSVDPKFTRPSARDRVAAVGSLSRLSAVERKAFDPSDSAFDPIPNPGPSDWLANHHEQGQSYQRYLRSHPNRPDRVRSKIYLQPIGDIDLSDGPSLDSVADYARAFFAMPVETLPTVSDKELPVAERMNRGKRQLLSTDILHWLQPRVPQDAYCLLAVTMIDLYPDPEWNYVFGQASLRERVGVYSFVRYSPKFWGQQPDPKSDSLMLQRSCRVLTHETGHMFGIKHCVHFHCVMNGSNHLDESDSQPLHLCPVCLRKLHSAIGFEISDRYQQLKTFSESQTWDDEATWLADRIDRIAGE